MARPDIMRHAGRMLKAYLDDICPQAQARIIECPRPPGEGVYWRVTVLHKAASPSLENSSVYAGHETMRDFCLRLLKTAGYISTTAEGKIYYA